MQAQDLPAGFEYGERTVFKTVALIQGNDTQTSSLRVPLHSALQVKINGRVSGGGYPVEHATIYATLSDDTLEIRRGIDAHNPEAGNRNLTGTTDGVDHIIFGAEKLGTTTVTLTPVSGSPSNWNGTSMTLTVVVYEPTVKTEGLSMPATVTLNEGDTRNVSID